MKKIFLMLCLCLGAHTLVYASDIEKEFPAEAGGMLVVELETGGSLDIRGWDQPLATVQVDFRHGDPDDYDFSIEPSRDGLRIESESRHRVNRTDIRVRVMLPKEYDLDLETAGGSVRIEDLSGRFRGRTGGGSLELQNLTGDIRLTTGGGSVYVRDSKLDGRVTTGGGTVKVENVEGDFDARSGGGDVVFSNVTKSSRDRSSGHAYIRSGGGDVRVDDAPEGADVSTGGGDIFVRSAGKFVEATTGGGDIEVEATTGRVRATTGAGDIDVTVVSGGEAGDIILVTGYGDVTLTVPSSLSMDVDIELAFTKPRQGRYDITSDFDLQKETSPEWDYDNGTPRKYIYGSATVNDGRNRVKIRNVNGNVRLLRGD